MKYGFLALLLLGSALAGGGGPPPTTLLNASGRAVEVAVCTATVCSPWKRLRVGELWRLPEASVLLSVSAKPGVATDVFLSSTRSDSRLQLVQSDELGGFTLRSTSDER